MIMIFYVLIFIGCSVLLYKSCEKMIEEIVCISRLFGLKEFMVAFFVMAFVASLPNLFTGVTSAIRGIPELSFGDVGGNNVVALTLAMALAVFFTKDGKLSTESVVVQRTSLFTAFATIIPLILILDGELSRADGVILILFFIFYNVWIFSKKDRFFAVYDGQENLSEKKKIKDVFKGLRKIAFGILLAIGAVQGIVLSAIFFAEYFNISVMTIGFLVTGLGSALPEIYFAIISARKGQTKMILGNLMGAVIVPSTLVLGIVAIIQPIIISDFSPFAISRIFIIMSVLFFFFFAKTGRKITNKEAIVLLGIYALFILAELSRI